MTVASERACDPLALLDEPFWRLLWHFYHIREREHRRLMIKRLARVEMGLLNSHAWSAPSTLVEELQKVQAALDEIDEGPKPIPFTKDELRARGMALASRIAAGHVLAPDALVS